MADAIVIPIIGKDQASSALKAVRGQVVGLGDDAKESSGLLSKLGGAVASLGGFVLKAGLAAATAAFVGFGAALADGVQDARAHALVMAQTEQTITSMGNAAGVSAEHVEDFAASLSAAKGKSLFGDDQIQAATNMLLTFGNIKGATLDLATTLTVDMAQALKKTPEDMSIMVGKILNSADAMSAAQRQGVSFSDAQLALGKRLFETGHIAEYQQLVLDELNKEFGGQAEAAAKADGGWAQLQDRWGEAKETLSTAVLPLLNTLVGTLNDSVMPVIEGAAARFGDLIPWLENFAQSLQIGAMWSGHLGEVITNALAPVLGDELAGIIGQAIDGFQRLGSSVSEALQPLIATFTDAETPIQGLIAVLSQVSPAFALLYGVASEIFPQLRALVLEIFGDIVAYFQANGAQMLAEAQTTFQSIHDTVLSLIQPLAEVISAVLEQIAVFWQAHDDEILGFIGSTWTQINQIIQTAMQLIQATIIPLLQGIASFIRDHTAEIQQIFSGAWQIISSVIDAALTLIKGVLTAALQAIQGDWSGAWQTIQDMSARIVADILGVIKGGLDLIQGSFNASIDAIKAIWQGLIGDAAGIGNDIVMGILNGVQGAANQLIGYMQSLAQQALDTVNTALGRHSPSIEFAKIGEDSIAGWVEGLDRAAPDLVSMLTGIADDAVTPLSDAVDHELAASLTGVGADIYDTTDNLRELVQQLGMTWDETNTFDEALRALGTTLQDAGPGSMEAQQAFDALMQTFDLSGSVADELRSRIAQLAGATDRSATQMVAASGQISDSWLSALQLISGQIDDSRLPDDAQGLGDAIIAGWAEGMDAAFGDLLGQVDSMSDKLKQEMNNAWDVSSPSGVTEALGSNIMLGLLDGLEGGLPHVLGSLQEISGVLEAQMGEISEQLSGKLTDEARKALETQRDSLQETIDAIVSTVEDLPEKVHSALADAFDASADIDRQQMKNIDAVRRLSDTMQAETQSALDQALTEASKIQDPEQAAKFFKEQSDHILELAKLNDAYYAAINSGDTEHAADLERQIALAKSAQAAEQRAFGERSQIAGTGALGNLHDVLEQITNTVTDPGSGPLHDLLAQLYDLQVRTDAAQSGVGVPPQQAAPGAPGASTSMVMQQGAIVINATPGMNEQMIADTVMREIERRYQGRL